VHNLTKHKMSRHQGVRFACDMCEYRATTPKNLRTHKMAKHDKIRYPCKQCDYRATVLCDLKKHMLTKHEGLRYPCNLCDYLGTTNHNLKKHKQSKHLGIRYPCDSCDHRATDPVNLKRHKLTKHSGERFPCENCDHKSTTPSDLKKHIVSKHDGARFSCELCEYVGTEWNLKKHRLAKHKPLLACQICCAYEALSLEELRAHVAALHHQPDGGGVDSGGAGGYPCASCSFVAQDEGSWRRHNFLGHTEAANKSEEEEVEMGRLKMESQQDGLLQNGGAGGGGKRYQCGRCNFASPLYEYLGKKRCNCTSRVARHVCQQFDGSGMSSS
jgi:C2H2-type zinc-finger domain/Zinc finger, C2H2 type